LLKIADISLIDKQIERITHHCGEVLEMQIMEEKPVKDPNLVLHYAMIDSLMVFIRGDTMKVGKN